jgi:hypothetical protein
MKAHQESGAPAAWIKQIFHKLDDAAPGEIITLIDSARMMLHEGGSSFARLGDTIAQAGIEFRSPELEPDAPLNQTIARLILTRHRRALGLAGEVMLSGLIDKLRRGHPVSNGDIAKFRDAQARVRLAAEGATA